MQPDDLDLGELATIMSRKSSVYGREQHAQKDVSFGSALEAYTRPPPNVKQSTIVRRYFPTQKFNVQNARVRLHCTRTYALL